MASVGRGFHHLAKKHVLLQKPEFYVVFLLAALCSGALLVLGLIEQVHRLGLREEAFLTYWPEVLWIAPAPIHLAVSALVLWYYLSLPYRRPEIRSRLLSLGGSQLVAAIIPPLLLPTGWHFLAQCVLSQVSIAEDSFWKWCARGNSFEQDAVSLQSADTRREARSQFSVM